ncbi:MAG TPA: phosphoribosylamine--glycine ligase [Virgibacillus sp.]|nr:phosphoribosylamine--glycine ligase [Virgibacillus sp.]
MNVFVIGRGGREHSLVKKIRESNQLDTLYVAPGNGGMEREAICVPIEETDIDGLTAFAKDNAIDLTIVGPENPLMIGIANRFREENLVVFAPTKEAAQLEGSKQFAKSFMNRHGIPTAEHQTFTDPEAAKAYIMKKGAPIVVKADGLAAGKGVIVAETVEEACSAVDGMLIDGNFAEAGATVVIEEFLDGKEFSLMAFVNGRHVYPMIPARDHKRAYDDDKGPNTGGMGAFAPVPDVTDSIIDDVTENVLQKACNGMVEEGIPFTGVLYAGLMMTPGGPKVIEFNTRFGDPETQVVLPLLQNDLLQVLTDVMADKDPHIEWETNQACVGVVIAAKGYPEKYEKNQVVPTLTVTSDAFTVYAGVKMTEEGMQSNGGRVFLVGAKGTTIDTARTNVYQCISPLEGNEGFFNRTDIGASVES